MAVGFSGGLDSTVLLDVTCRVASELGAPPPLALHVHHGLHDDADRWADHCASTANRLGADFRLWRVEVARDTGRGLEAAAREARLRVFGDTEADAILLGHHRDDLAETVLLNMLRGSGLSGLAGMRPARLLQDGRLLLRPFLGLSRGQLRDHAIARQLAWVEDPSNHNDMIRRNHLRQVVLPLIETRMPQARPALARLAAHAAEARLLIDELADLDAAAHMGDGGLKCRAFTLLPVHRARNLLRRQLALAGLRMPDAARLDEMLRQLAGRGRPQLRHDGHLVSRRRGCLLIGPEG